MELAGFQEDAVAQVAIKVRQALRGDADAVRTTVLRSPTGSGKTVMAGTVMEDLGLDALLDVAFIWIAPYSLQQQAGHSLRSLLGAKQKITNGAELSDRDVLDRGEIVFLNWSSVNKDENKLRTGGESRASLREICSSTHDEGRKLVLVVDESHHSRETARANEVVEEISPDAILEMSATPDIVVPGARAEVGVPRRDVVEEGFIRERILVNPGLSGLQGEIDEGKLLELAVAMRSSLAEAHAAAGAPVNPLLLIQVPDSAAGDEAMIWVKDRLSQIDRPLTYDNGRLARWLSADRTHDPEDPELIANAGSVEALIFKQAIATGWDCPRAQVLLKLRDPGKNERFEIQTLGRIMRMPQRRHYDDDALNQGYVFHSHSEYEPAEDMAVATAHSNWKAGLAMPELPVEWMSRVHAPYLDGETLDAIISEIRDGLSLSGGIVANRKVLTDSGIALDVDVTQLIHEGELSGEDADALKTFGVSSIGMSQCLVERRFDRLVRQWLGLTANPGAFKDELYDLFEGAVGLSKPSAVQALVVAHRDVLESVFVKAVEDVSPRSDRRKRHRNNAVWGPQTPRFFNTQVGDTTKHEAVDAEKYAYEPCFLSTRRSKPERAFEEWLTDDEHGLVEWWFKNGEGAGKDYSLVFEVEGVERNFFPDFVMRLTDGALCLVETKELEEAFVDGRDVAGNVAKLAALRDWIAAAPEGQPRGGGFIVQRRQSGSLRYALETAPTATYPAEPLSRFVTGHS